MPIRLGWRRGWTRTPRPYGDGKQRGFHLLKLEASTCSSSPEIPNRDVSCTARQALVNRMGFNNNGSEKIQRALDHHTSATANPAYQFGSILGNQRSHRYPTHMWITVQRLSDFGPTVMCSSSTSLHPTHPTSGSCRTTKVWFESLTLQRNQPAVFGPSRFTVEASLGESRTRHDR